MNILPSSKFVFRKQYFSYVTDHLPQDIIITDLSCDSRKVRPGYIFFALDGVNVRGSTFIDDAIKNGAVVIIAGMDCDATKYSIPVINYQNPRLAMGEISANFYPIQPDNIVAVTGTSGKSSVVHFCRLIWRHMGMDAGSVGTIGMYRNEEVIHESGLTTPDTITLHKILNQIAVNNLAIEASSHGLDQYRLDHVRIKAAAFTNFSREHLDYHLDMQDYFQAKLRLFTELLPEDGIAVLNADIPEYDLISKQVKHVIDYGYHADEIKLLKIEHVGYQQQVTVRIHGQTYQLNINLVGEFQVSNILCALGLVLACGAPLEGALDAIDKLTAVPGRMERVEGSNIFIDYSHKPDALATALKELRKFTSGRLLVLFGCGGNRDQGKRPEMGKIASELADVVIVTDDNPRHEDPAAIRQQIIAACNDKAIQIGGRKQAIEHIVSIMQPEDTVLIAGKGHETVQIIGDQTFPFDDKKIVQELLAAIISAQD